MLCMERWILRPAYEWVTPLQVAGLQLATEWQGNLTWPPSGDQAGLPELCLRWGGDECSNEPYLREREMLIREALAWL